MAEWFSDVLGVSCNMVRRTAKKRWTRSGQNKFCVLPTKSGRSTPIPRSELSFVNEGQFLLVSRASIDYLNKRLASSGQGSAVVEALQFRPNLVVSGGSPYAEDAWSAVNICNERLLVMFCPSCRSWIVV